MTGEIKGGLIIGLLVLLVLAYLACIFLPRQRCPHCNKWFSLPTRMEQMGDRERVMCRWCGQMWERFSYGGGVGPSGGGGDGGHGGSFGG